MSRKCATVEYEFLDMETKMIIIGDVLQTFERFGTDADV